MLNDDENESGGSVCRLRKLNHVMTNTKYIGAAALLITRNYNRSRRSEAGLLKTSKSDHTQIWEAIKAGAGSELVARACSGGQYGRIKQSIARSAWLAQYEASLQHSVAGWAAEVVYMARVGSYR